MLPATCRLADTLTRIIVSANAHLEQLERKLLDSCAGFGLLKFYLRNAYKSAFRSACWLEKHTV